MQGQIRFFILLSLLTLLRPQTTSDFQSQRSSHVTLKEAEVNIMTFTCGTVDMQTGNPVLYPEPFRYSFEELPRWLTAQNNKIVGVPPPGESGSTTIKVNYEGIKNNIKGQFEYTVSYGEFKPTLPVASKILTYFKAEVKFNKTLNAPSGQGHFVVLVPFLLPSQIKKLQESRTASQPATISPAPLTARASASEAEFKYNCSAVDFFGMDRIRSATVKSLVLARGKTVLIGECTSVTACKNKKTFEVGEAVSYNGKMDGDTIYAKEVSCLG